MFLFFHLETDGLPKSWKAPHTDTNNWPKPTKLAWATFDKFGERIKAENHSLDDNNLAVVLQLFADEIVDNKYVVSHNFEFQSKVIASAFHRLNMDHKLFFANTFCTMQEGTYYCGIRGRYGKLKWPKLAELYKKIFNITYDNSDSPLSDVMATSACLFELVKMEEVDLF